MASATATTRETLVRAIALRLRSGAVYRYCDTDGYHDEVAFRDGRYVHVDGFRAGSNTPTRLADEEAAITVMRTMRPQSDAESEIGALESILASLEDEQG